MSTSKKTHEGNFWDWFRKNEEKLFHLNIDSEQEREAVFDELVQALAGVSPDLTFELGPELEGKRELVLSAGGIKSAFPSVEALVQAAPSFSRWRFTKFRPRRAPIMQITLGEKTVSPEEVECCILSNGSELGLYLFFPDYVEEQRPIWGQVGYLFLDEALGEYDVEMKVGLIDFLPFDAHSDAVRFPLTELSERFDKHYAE